MPSKMRYQVFHVHPFTGKWSAWSKPVKTEAAARVQAAKARKWSDNGRVAVQRVR